MFGVAVVAPMLTLLRQTSHFATVPNAVLVVVVVVVVLVAVAFLRGRNAIGVFPARTLNKNT